MTDKKEGTENPGHNLKSAFLAYEEGGRDALREHLRRVRQERLEREAQEKKAQSDK